MSDDRHEHPNEHERVWAEIHDLAGWSRRADLEPDETDSTVEIMRDVWRDGVEPES